MSVQNSMVAAGNAAANAERRDAREDHVGGGRRFRATGGVHNNDEGVVYGGFTHFGVGDEA